VLRASSARLRRRSARRRSARESCNKRSSSHRVVRGESEGDGRADERDGNKSFFIAVDEVAVGEKAERETEREMRLFMKEYNVKMVATKEVRQYSRREIYMRFGK